MSEVLIDEAHRLTPSIISHVLAARHGQICSTCKWWDDEPVEYMGSEWHDCIAPDEWGDYAREPDREVWAVPPWTTGMTLHDYNTRPDATLATRATFGCNAWEAKDEEPHLQEAAPSV